jgi:hypothetical protein
MAATEQALNRLENIRRQIGWLESDIEMDKKMTLCIVGIEERLDRLEKLIKENL